MAHFRDSIVDTIEVKFKTGIQWNQFTLKESPHYELFSFNDYKVRIHGVVYEKNNEDYRKGLAQARMWRDLAEM
jgi:hypothetical protein